MFHVLKEWPHVSRNPTDLLSIVPRPYLSLDWEWDVRTGNPSILGVSDGERTVSVPHREGRPYLLRLLEQFPTAVIIGHNFLSADYGVAVRDGFTLRPDSILDTIHLHWLTNMSLCKGTKKADDEEGEKRGRGYMNLYCAVSLHTDAPNWKECWGNECELLHNPCPKHDPFGYNGNDCYWLVHAVPHMLQRARLMGVDRLLPLHRDTALVLSRMHDRGVLVDVAYVETKLRSKFISECERISALLPFNPDSNQQVPKYFGLPNAQEKTIRDAVEEAQLDDIEEGTQEFAALSPPQQHLILTLNYKELGNGPDRWFKPRSFDYSKNEWTGYVDADGYIHCNLQFFTSTGRLACSNPNLQNVSKRRKDRVTGESFGKLVRRAIIAPPGYYLYRADLKNAENRVFLHLAGYTELPELDFHNWMRDMIGLREDDPFCISQGNAREAAKTVTHATDYMEGLQLLEPSQLRNARIVSEVSKGARLVFPDWKVFGKVVSFTGINLARRAFGDASHSNRKRALDVTSKYIEGTFPKLRGLQQAITSQVERERCVRPPTGYVLASYGYETDRLKSAAAMWGSNPVAHVTKYAMINAEQHPHLIPVLQVHDELLFYVDCRHEPKKVAQWIRECMEIEIPEIRGLVIPAEPSYGPNWADQSKIA